MPVLFFGHGNPMNAITENAYAKKWNAIGRGLPKPTAVLAVSAHWYVDHTAVTVSPAPRTIHDFGGFPRELYDVQYPAPGDPRLAERVRDRLAPAVPVALDERWGIDHGTWSVLVHLFPDADVPVVQLSIDERKAPQFHYEVGKRLGALRDEGVLVIGSGNVVHNLHAFAWGRHAVGPYDWAVRFESRVRELLLARDDVPLLDYPSLGEDAQLSVPTPDHYLPLLYVLGTRRESDTITFPVEGVDGGSISMLAVDLR
ncbi:MAG: 4,5-DOPA-extradiol-dioxygenase [Vulcanimicrobiaceae bacterium]